MSPSLMNFFWNYISKCTYLMNKMTPVSVYRLFSSLSNKQIVFDSFQETPCSSGTLKKDHEFLVNSSSLGKPSSGSWIPNSHVLWTLDIGEGLLLLVVILVHKIPWFSVWRPTCPNLSNSCNTVANLELKIQYQESLLAVSTF